jgi:hypothetical protein
VVIFLIIAKIEQLLIEKLAQSAAANSLKITVLEYYIECQLNYEISYKSQISQSENRTLYFCSDWLD